jgi:hypothetical protein
MKRQRNIKNLFVFGRPPKLATLVLIRIRVYPLAHLITRVPYRLISSHLVRSFVDRSRELERELK